MVVGLDLEEAAVDRLAAADHGAEVAQVVEVLEEVGKILIKRLL